MGQQGLVFIFLPALFIVSGFAISFLSKNLKLITVMSILVIDIVIFLLLPEYPLGPGSQRILNWSTIKNSDEYYQGRFDLIQKTFNPSSTFILAVSWHHVEYYLPEYSILTYNVGDKWEVDQGKPIGNSTYTVFPQDGSDYSILFFDPSLLPYYRGTDEILSISEDNITMVDLKIDKNHSFIVYPEGFDVK